MAPPIFWREAVADRSKIAGQNVDRATNVVMSRNRIKTSICELAPDQPGAIRFFHRILGGMLVETEAVGTFDVKLTPVGAGDGPIASMSINIMVAAGRHDYQFRYTLPV